MSINKSVMLQTSHWTAAPWCHVRTAFYRGKVYSWFPHSFFPLPDESMLFKQSNFKVMYFDGINTVKWMIANDNIQTTTHLHAWTSVFISFPCVWSFSSDEIPRLDDKLRVSKEIIRPFTSCISVNHSFRYVREKTATQLLEPAMLELVTALCAKIIVIN